MVTLVNATSQAVPDVQRALERWGVSKSVTKAATSAECARQNRMIPRFLLLSESCSGLFVTDLDTMLGLLEGDVSGAVARQVLEATG